ncbi:MULTISPECIES: PA2779 family protein [unclassified Halomonas]|uniref:PA2779 family protein n=1 Tax=unclassified Halomonas TaxID=2609666 RepID=UPI0021E4F469|nr:MULTISPECIES: PA2779 family protein [unclassified Halomonas]UYG01353.1 PA2779 family protein [Halomonas sp. GD1P12]WNL37590.1 PA2779 family protein [Halomonas sp. PAMB 3232]WNL40904.1 PA2779 family protein [Halomonas sp. PAMB 3264]
MKTLRSTLSALLILALVVTSLPIMASVDASNRALISTQSVLASDQAGAERQRISDVLARADVQQALVNQGVDPVEVQARVAALSDSEAKEMAQRLDELPAGASGVVGALFAVFIILLITDILGLTDVYPFTR